MVVKSNEPSFQDRLSANLSTRQLAMLMTQAQLAEKLGVDTETLSRFELGKHLPSLITLEKLAKSLQTTISELLTEKTPSPATDAETMSAWLDDLSSEDRRFFLAHSKRLAQHLRKAAES